MQAQDLISGAILKATGEVYTGEFGDDDSTKMLGIANMYIPIWASEPGADWNSLYEVIDIGTVSATDTFDLDDSIRVISTQPGDFVRITHTDGTNHTDYTTIKPKQLKRYASGNYCAKVGSTLVFNKAFTSDSPQLGGTISVPSYLFADLLVDAGDEVPVDNPMWLLLMCAAEWVRNDITLAQNYPSLVAEANDLMLSMKLANRPQEETVVLGSVGIAQRW